MRILSIQYVLYAVVLPSFMLCAAGAQAEPRPMKASALIGMQVRNPDTGSAGRIDDLVIDLHNSRVHYAVLDMEQQLHTEPLGDLRFPAGKDYAVVVAPDPSPVEPRSGMALVRASTLLGWEVESDPGRDLGRLTDLVVDPASGAVPFAVLRLHENGNLHAVPADAFELHALRENLVLDVDPSRLLPGQAFTPEALETGLAQGDYLEQLASSADALTPDASAATGASRAPGSDEMFRKLDRNGDGVLSDAELDRRASERRNWIALDLDRDGRITRREFTGVRGPTP